MSRVACSAILVSALVAVQPSPARAGEGPISWSFQAVDTYPSVYFGHRNAMAMRTGATWPTVFYEGTNQTSGMEQSLIASSLTPVGWRKSVLDPYLDETSGVRSKAGQDGRIGAVWQPANSGAGGVKFA